ncbi:MAG TPA: hypothetical protein VIL09_01885 [Microvirga sp.]|jgi:hypothetical protein
MELQAHRVSLAGHGVSDDGRFGILVFTNATGEPLPLAVPIEQLGTLLKAVVLTQTEIRTRLGPDAPAAEPIPIDRWMTARAGDLAVVSFTIFQTAQVQFAVTPATIRD